MTFNKAQNIPSEILRGFWKKKSKKKEITPSLIFMKISPYINYENGVTRIDSISIKKVMDELYLRT